MKKRILLVLLVLIILSSINVSAAYKTIKGTKYTTTYDPVELKKVFTGIIEVEKYDSASKSFKKTGELVLGDTYTSTNLKDCPEEGIFVKGYPKGWGMVSYKLLKNKIIKYVRKANTL